MADTTPIYLEEYKALHPADLADRLQRMSPEEARHILTELPVEEASAALAELVHKQQTKAKLRKRFMGIS